MNLRSLLHLGTLAITLFSTSYTFSAQEPAALSHGDRVLHSKKSKKQKHWVATWSQAPVNPQTSALIFPPQYDLPGMTFNDQTIRIIAHISLGGSCFRVRLSNIYSFDNNAYMTIGSAHIALRDGASPATVAGSDRQLTFNGETTVIIPPNASILSDPVHLDAPDFSDLAVIVYLPLDNSFPGPRHLIAEQTSYITPAASGDYTQDQSGVPFTETTTQSFYVADIEVLASKDKRAIVCFGDSITDGNSFNYSTLDTNSTYPDFLAYRLKCDKNLLGVVNSGVSLDQVLFNVPLPGEPLWTAGLNALSRFDTDALTKAAVKYVIFMDGGNDIGVSYCFSGLNPYPATFDMLTGAYVQFIDRCHDLGIKIYGGTLTPSSGVYPCPEAEALRQQINTWIRTSGRFDAVIDFDKAVRDPLHPDKLLPAYNSGDGLHPNSAGYQAMANCIDLNLFRDCSEKKSKNPKCKRKFLANYTTKVGSTALPDALGAIH